MIKIPSPFLCVHYETSVWLLSSMVFTHPNRILSKHKSCCMINYSKFQVAQGSGHLDKFRFLSRSLSHQQLESAFNTHYAMSFVSHELLWGGIKLLHDPGRTLMFRKSVLHNQTEAPNSLVHPAMAFSFAWKPIIAPALEAELFTLPTPPEVNILQVLKLISQQKPPF